MLRFLKIAIPSFAIGTVFGAAFWYLASPLWIDRVVDENLAVVTGDQVIATGALRDADASHKGSGDVKLVTLADGRSQIQFSNFTVTNGPDLKIYMSAHPDPQNSGDVKDNEFLSLGVLKGNIGDQAYDIPAGTDLSKYGSVTVWCEQFGVLFASAALTN